MKLPLSGVVFLVSGGVCLVSGWCVRVSGILPPILCSVFHHISGQFQGKFCIGKFLQKIHIAKEPPPHLEIPFDGSLEFDYQKVPFSLFKRIVGLCT